MSSVQAHNSSPGESVGCLFKNEAEQPPPPPAAAGPKGRVLWDRLVAGRMVLSNPPPRPSPPCLPATADSWGRKACSLPEGGRAGGDGEEEDGKALAGLPGATGVAPWSPWSRKARPHRNSADPGPLWACLPREEAGEPSRRAEQTQGPPRPIAAF